MKKSFLQNNSGELQYPARIHWSELRIKDFNIGEIFRYFFLLVALIAAANLIFSGLAYLNFGWIGVVVFVSLIGLGVYRFANKIKNKSNIRVAEQLEYYNIGKLSAPTESQLQVLQLIAYQRFSFGEWTDTIDYFPLERRIKHRVNALYIFQKTYVQSIAKSLEKVYKWWGIETVEDYFLIQKSLMEGMHTQEFLEMYYQVPDFLVDIASISGLSGSYILDCLQYDSNKPTKLIWAWDLCRAISLATDAYAADLIDEALAWNHMYKAANTAFRKFDSLAEFLDNIRLGHAYWCRDEVQIAAYKKMINTYLNPKAGTERLTHAAIWPKGEVLVDQNSIYNNSAQN